MKMQKIIFLLMFVMICDYAFSQNRISLSNKNPLYMEMAHNHGTGGPKTELKDDNQWLNYTTLVQLSDPNLCITAQIVSGTMPEGMTLQLEAMPYQGLSKGKQGSPAGKITLSYTPQVLISNIGTAYTGNGKNEGYQLIYTYITRDFSRVSSGSSAVYVQYTITH